MKLNQKGFTAIALVGIVLLIFIVGFASWRIFEISQPSNVKVRIISGSGGMPPYSSSGNLLDETATVVFTEPFLNLDEYEKSKVISKKTTSSGIAEFNLEPGKYGLLLEYDDREILYNKLEVDGSIPAQKIRDRGVWFVEVKDFDNEFSFSINELPV